MSDLELFTELYVHIGRLHEENQKLKKDKSDLIHILQRIQSECNYPFCAVAIRKICADALLNMTKEN